MLEGIYLRASGVIFFVGAVLAGIALFVVTTTSSGIASLGPLGAPPLVVVGLTCLLVIAGLELSWSAIRGVPSTSRVDPSFLRYPLYGIGMLLLVGIPIVGFYLVAGEWILSELANDTLSPTLETTG